MANINRRHFLNRTAGFGLAASFGGLAQMTASKSWAANTGGYKAIVCILLKGGMDHADTLLPFDVASLDALIDERQELFEAYGASDPSSTRHRDNLLELDADNLSNFGGRQFALPPELAGLKDMFDNNDMAVIGGVGPLIQPTTRAQMDAGTAILPPRLFSHNDQQSTWMKLGTSASGTGWGGRFADAMIKAAPTNDPLFAAMAPTTDMSFLTGDTARSFNVATSGVRLPSITQTRNYLGTGSEKDAVRARLNAYFLKTSTDEQNVLFKDSASMAGRGISNSTRLAESLEMLVDFTTTFPTTGLGKQLKSIAEMIKIQSTLNVSRQVFFATMGGFDTHKDQAARLGPLHRQISDALLAFRSALQEISRWNDVVTFTASDFGRTLNSNGNGTDHGWGGNHFVMGGAVNGKNIYGDIAVPDVTHSSYTATRGRLIPTVSVEQYAATIGSWFGLDSAELNAALPNLGNFDNRTLGFL